MKPLPRPPRQVAIAASLWLPLLTQLLGLNVLCFCGHCPSSQILWPSGDPSAGHAQTPALAEGGADESHACCHHRDAQGDDTEARATEPESLADDAATRVETAPALTGTGCCGDDHAWRVPTTLGPEHATATPWLAWLPHPAALAPTAVPPRRERLASQPGLARGPPPVPLFLRNLSLQI